MKIGTDSISRRKNTALDFKTINFLRMAVPSYITHNDADIHVLGSHRGKIVTSREHLVHLFGRASKKHDKCSCHWTVKFLEDGLVVTIYDFMGINDDADIQESRVWDVGGYKDYIPKDRFRKLGLRVISSPH